MRTIAVGAIRRSEVLRYLGFGAMSPEESFLKRIDALENTLRQTMHPRFLYRLLPLTEDADGTPCIDGLRLSGKDIHAHLHGCTQVILLAATLSAETDRLLARVQIQDMADALIADAIANAAIESVCDNAEQQIAAQLPEKYLTWRFSPGYGDFPLEMQQQLLCLLDAPRKIGLTATDCAILIPKKSVTALIGISSAPVPKQRRGCAVCTMRESCPYHIKGVHCGNVESTSQE